MTPERKAEFDELMFTHKLNVKRVAALLNVSESWVYQWRNGRRQMPEREWEFLKLMLGAVPTGKTLRVGEW